MVMDHGNQSRRCDKMSTVKRFYLNLILLLSLIANLLLGLAVGSNLVNSAEKFPYLSKRIFAQSKNDLLINFVPLRQMLKDFDQKTELPIGIYFEYLPSGVSIGVNEKEVYFGASLLKVPVAMKTYKLIGEGKIKKDQELIIEEKHLDKGFGDLWQKGAGTKISVREAVELSLAKSDNTADKLLRDLVKENPVSEVFDYLDIPTDVAKAPGAGVTAKNYSSIFRSLYLSSYLFYENSNEILEILTTSPYKDRILAGVPSNVKVAHKIGIYKEPGKDESQTHADCGIVYAPKRPYILCVMTDSLLTEATQEISQVSKIIYEYVISANH